MTQPALIARTSPALHRLSALAPLDASAVTLLEAALATEQIAPARRDFIREGEPIGSPRLITSGWAARVRILPDGRRQFLSFLLAGDLIGLCRHASPVSVSTVTALTEVTLCQAPRFGQSEALDQAYAVSQALEEMYLLEQIARLGRMNAQERIYSLLLELHERLSLNGLAEANAFAIPLTQEMLGDALGLTAVHINRMVQQTRQLGDIEWRGRTVFISDSVGLARRIGRSRTGVTEARS